MQLSKKAFGLTAGILWGLAAFLVTNYRILTGGTGVFLSNIELFYFGYSYSFLGSIIGLIWGFIYGFIVGWLFAFFYNLFVKKS
jgi:hypothetical protein